MTVFRLCEQKFQRQQLLFVGFELYLSAEQFSSFIWVIFVGKKLVVAVLVVSME